MQRTVVIPGQVIAVSSDADQDGGFLRGHGTYVETLNGGDTTRLVSSVLGTVERVNKLISVIPSASPNFYAGQVGDLVIGRISSVGSSRWTVQLCSRPGRQREVRFLYVFLPLYLYPFPDRLSYPPPHPISKSHICSFLIHILIKNQKSDT